MTIQYNVPIKVLDESREWIVQGSLTKYKVFSDRSGHLDRTCFSKEDLPYVGKVIVMKTLKSDAAQTAYDVLKGIEGLLVLPITECIWEEDEERVARILREKKSA